MTFFIPRESVLKIKFQAYLFDHVGSGHLSNPAEVKHVRANFFGKSLKLKRLLP